MRRRGRPARTPEPGERVPMSFRVTPAFKAKLDRAADESGRSLMQEIELRLEQSLDHERHLLGALELGFGRQAAGLMLAIGYVIKAAERPGIGSLSDPEVFREIVESINLLLQAIDPDDVHPAAWAIIRKAIRHGDGSDGELQVSIVLDGISDPVKARTAEEFAPLTSLIRTWLGKAVVARVKDRLAQEE
jgi:predicted transcriptional regulator